MTSSSNARPGASLLRYLLRAGLGLSAASVAACGGNVVVDSSTLAQSSTSTGSTTGTITNTGDCEPSSLTFEKTTVCVGPGSDGSCRAFDAPTLPGDVLEELSDSGCCEGELSSILCGPRVMPSGECCYEVDGYACNWCEGRPFVVDDAPRVASVEARDDWGAAGGADAPAVGPDMSALGAGARAALAAAWTRSALDEHASIASFARFTLEVLAVGAPAEIVAGAQRAMGDEIRHAERCFALASAYAGHAVGPGALAIDGAAPRDGLAEIAAATVREGCVGETLAAFEAAAARDEAADPAVRAALDQIARDEAEHAALAFRFVAWAIRAGGEGVRAAVERELHAVRTPRPADREEGWDDEVMRAHGRLPPATRALLAASCLREVVAPCAAALLEATLDIAPTAAASHA